VNWVHIAAKLYWAQSARRYALQIHHLNCATLCPPLARALVHPLGYLVCHCLLIEASDGLVLVDTGLGRDDLRAPKARLGALFLLLGRPRCDPAETALAQIQARGFQAHDVRHIVVTHLDPDHAGGLADFPAAEVHVYTPEHAAAMARATRNDRQRYHPAHWSDSPRWRLHSVEGERWLGFEAVRVINQRQPEILLVPLVGHTAGHCGVAVQADGGWLLHCGDAYFAAAEVNATPPRSPKALAFFQQVIAADNTRRRANQERLRGLVRSHSGEVRVFCAHDPGEFAQLRT
jgi:glyoxylase-like metal-dependent hydrolase (beta-lactamase superfamily II)